MAYYILKETVKVCDNCNGRGEVFCDESHHGSANWVKQECPECHGRKVIRTMLTVPFTREIMEDILEYERELNKKSTTKRPPNKRCYEESQ